MNACMHARANTHTHMLKEIVEVRCRRVSNLPRTLQDDFTLLPRLLLDALPVIDNRDSGKNSF